MYGYQQAYQSYGAPVYQANYAVPLYAQTADEYFGPAKRLTWTPTEREELVRDLPGPLEADKDRSRAIYEGMNEYEREDWDTDLWGQQLLRYELDDARNAHERSTTYAQDKARAELDEVWEFYKKQTAYKHEHQYDSYGYDKDYQKYDKYDRLDVRETMLRANQLWDAEVQAVRQEFREGLEAERQAHRDAVAEIVARREAELAALKAAMIERRLVKRADLDALNTELDAEVRRIIAEAQAEVNALNLAHQELVLEILEAVDLYGEEADVKLILTAAGEGDIDLYGDQVVHALYREEREAEYKPTKYQATSYGRKHAYTRPSYGY